jgi:excisionase family DNA binding protein
MVVVAMVAVVWTLCVVLMYPEWPPVLRMSTPEGEDSGTRRVPNFVRRVVPMCLTKIVRMHKVGPMQPTLLTTAEVAGRLRVSIPTVNRWVRDGRLTPVQKLPGIRGANLFDPSDIDTLKEVAAGPALPGG